MARRLEIQGAPDELEAAVLAAVVDHIVQTETVARTGRAGQEGGLPAWVIAVRDRDHPLPVPAPPATMGPPVVG